MTELQATIDRQQARLRELETFLAMMVALNGRWTGSNWQFRLANENAIMLRKLLPLYDPSVSITADGDSFYVDVV